MTFFFVVNQISRKEFRDPATVGMRDVIINVDQIAFITSGGTIPEARATIAMPGAIFEVAETIGQIGAALGLIHDNPAGELLHPLRVDQF